MSLKFVGNGLASVLVFVVIFKLCGERAKEIKNIERRRRRQMQRVERMSDLCGRCFWRCLFLRDSIQRRDVVLIVSSEVMTAIVTRAIE